MRPVVLLVDDDVTLLHTTSKMLEIAGFDSVLAESPARVLDLIQNISTTVVLLDMFMPERDGIEIIQEIRRLQPDLPIVAMSGGWRTMKSAQTLEVARALGADAVLAKPFGTGELAAFLARCAAAQRPHAA
ncbi:MAG TPA: response regulator [Phenylobacterium sp.]|nr:response regulator [Phenylobacterium sp.]